MYYCSFSFCTVQGIADKLVLLDFSEGTKGGMMDLDIFNLPNVEISKGLAILLQRFVPSKIWVSFSVRYFRAVSGSGCCWAEGTEVFFCVPPALYMHRLCIVNIPYLSSTIDRPPWTHDYHLKSIVYIRIHSCLCILWMWTNQTCIYHYSINQYFTALKILCVLPGVLEF